MTEASIRFATDILRRLGEELNPSIEHGILELAKNSHDADATECTVELFNVGEPNGSIIVHDNGDGMTPDAILNGWLVLGKSGKNTKKRTRLGRIPAGNKGLGRLAALRLGNQVTMTTRPAGSQAEYTVQIDWTRYDNAELVDDVRLPIQEQRRTSAKPGTTVTIRNLRQPAGRMDVKRLARALILLADPFTDDPSSFKPVLKSNEFEDLEQLVAQRYFQDAEYHLHAELKDGTATATVKDWRGRTLFEAEHAELMRDAELDKYPAPDASFDLWVFVLKRDNFITRRTTIGEVRNWIESFGGVHLYLNGLRVGPYGNPGNDWLDINLSRVRNPEERPSTNTSIGRVSVVNDADLLPQKTDRSGFIETPAFHYLRVFSQDALEWMARERLAQAELRRQTERAKAPERTQRSREALRTQIEQAPAAVREELAKAFDRHERAHQRETDALRREVQLYRTLSTAGITAATFAHESNANPLKIIGQSVNSIEHRGKRELEERYASTLEAPVGSIRRAADSLGVLSSATLRLIDADKRRVGRVDLHQVIRRVLKTFEPFLAGRDIEVVDDLSPGDPYLRGTEAAVESIITNLINNSLTALEEASDEQTISISTRVSDGNWTLSVSDSGPGITDITVREIWLPGHTSRANGTGLGLTIVRDAVTDLGGNVEAINNGPLGGATFVIHLPVLGA